MNALPSPRVCLALMMAGLLPPDEPVSRPGVEVSRGMPGERPRPSSPVPARAPSGASCRCPLLHRNWHPRLRAARDVRIVGPSARAVVPIGRRRRVRVSEGVGPVEPWTDAHEDSTVPVSVKLTVTVEAMALLERAWVTSWETLPALESFPTG